MNAVWLSYVFRLLTSLLAIYGFAYMVTAIGWPRFFLSNMALGRTDYREGRGRHPWWLWPLAALTFFSVGVVIFGALYPLISAIPFYWGSRDEDGEWSSTRDLVRILFVFFGSIGVIAHLEEVAKTLVWAPLERSARHVLADAIALNQTEGDKVRGAAERGLLRDLGPEKREVKDAGTEWRDALREAILRKIASRF